MRKRNRACKRVPPPDSQWEGALGAQKEKEEYRLYSSFLLGAQGGPTDFQKPQY